MKTITVSQSKMAELVSQIPYDFPNLFSVIFIKGNGEIRHMTCRRGVISRSAGVRDGFAQPYPPTYNFADHGLLPVFDVNKDPSESHDGKRGSYRSIPVDHVLQLKLDGTTYRTHSYAKQLRAS